LLYAGKQQINRRITPPALIQLIGFFDKIVAGVRFGIQCLHKWRGLILI
jgi:hypothetical protein